MYGMYSHVLGASHNGFIIVKLVVVDFHSIVPMVLITMAPLTTMFNSIMLPPNIGNEPPYLLKGSMDVWDFIIPFFGPYKELLNYFEYKRL
jgi:hypothetical protein